VLETERNLISEEDEAPARSSDHEVFKENDIFETRDRPQRTQSRAQKMVKRLEEMQRANLGVQKMDED
jgi:hypothetical protein